MGAIYSLDYLRARNAKQHLDNVKREVHSFLDTWMAPSGRRTELLQSLNKDLKSRLKESLDACQGIA